MRRRAANGPSKTERQAGDRPGHTGLSESLIWDSGDMPSLRHPLSRALELYFRERKDLTWKLTAIARLSVRETREGKRIWINASPRFSSSQQRAPEIKRK